MFRRIDPSIMDALAELRFEGDVWAVPEGTVVFPGETLLRVTAPLPQAQWVETYLVAAWLTRPWWRRRRRGSCRWPVAGRCRNSARGGGPGRTPGAWPLAPLT